MLGIHYCLQISQSLRGKFPLKFHKCADIEGCSGGGLNVWLKFQKEIHLNRHNLTDPCPIPLKFNWKLQ